MKAKISKKLVEGIEPGPQDQFIWDTDLKGFGCKITPKGARVYMLQYWHHGRARRYTLGRHNDGLKPEEARRKAISLKGLIADGLDPAASRAENRASPTLANFAERYLTEHAAVKKKPLSQAADERNLRNHILPALGRFKLTDISRADITRFHQAMKGTPGAANRCLALLSKMFNLAEKWGLRPDGTNPTRHVDKYPERKINRYLSSAELASLGQVLAEAADHGEHPSAIAAIRLLIMTGCRRDEILTLRWDQVDLEAKCLRFSDSKTGPKVIPLGVPAYDLLNNLQKLPDNPYVLPGTLPGKPFVGLGKVWNRLRQRAGLLDVRLHDLRHSFASVAAGMGESLILIGSLLGHSDSATTARYAHLSDDPRRAAADRIAERIATAMEGKPIDPTLAS